MSKSTNEQPVVSTQLTQEDYQCQQHEEYLRNVYESGYPSWILDTYHNGGY